MTAREIERLARLETQLENVCKRIDAQAVKLDAVHDALMSQRGARLALVSLVSIAGIIGGLVSSFLPR